MNKNMGKKKKATNYKAIIELIGGISILAAFGYALISKLVIRFFGTPSTPNSPTGGWYIGDFIFNSIIELIFLPFLILLSIFFAGLLYIGLKLTKKGYNGMKLDK